MPSEMNDRQIRTDMADLNRSSVSRHKCSSQVQDLTLLSCVSDAVGVQLEVERRSVQLCQRLFHLSKERSRHGLTGATPPKNFLQLALYIPFLVLNLKFIHVQVHVVYMSSRMCTLRAIASSSTDVSKVLRRMKNIFALPPAAHHRVEQATRTGKKNCEASNTSTDSVGESNCPAVRLQLLCPLCRKIVYVG